MVKDIEGGAAITGREWWFSTMCPKGTKLVEPIAKGALAFWIWPSLVITAVMILPLALMGATIMYAVAVAPLLIYWLVTQQYRYVIRGIERRPSRYLRVKAHCFKPDDAKLMCVEVDGSFELFLRFRDAVDADLYVLRWPHFRARDGAACWHNLF